MAKIKKLGDCTLKEAVEFENMKCDSCPLRNESLCGCGCPFSALTDLKGKDYLERYIELQE